jgi:hypothetical protein
MDTPRKNLFTQAKAWREGDRQNKPKNEAEKKTVLSLKREGVFAPYGETKQAMPDISPLRDMPINSKALPKGKLREDIPKGSRAVYARVKIKSQSSSFRSVSAVHTVAHMRADGTIDKQIVRHVADNETNSCPIDPAWKQGQKKIAKASCNYMRKAYSNSKAKAESVVVVRV